MKAKTVIVGGGIIGASIAMHAAQRNDPLRSPVVLVERGKPNFGSSTRSGAILRMLVSDRPLAQMARESMREYAGFESRTGRSIGFRRSGVMTLGTKSDPARHQRLKDMHALLREMGVQAEWVEGDAILQRVRDVHLTADTVGVWEPDGATLSPDLTVEAFTALSRTYGAVTRVGNSVEEVLVERGKVRGVRTTEGEVLSDQVVVTAGPWTGRLLRSVGIEVPLRVVRPEIVFFRMADSPASGEAPLHETNFGMRPNLGFDMSEGDHEVGDLGLKELTDDLHPVLIDFEHGFYARCEPNLGRTRVGRTVFDRDPEIPDPDVVSDDVSKDTIQWARQALERRMPEYRELGDAGSQAGLYTLTPDAQPLVGPVPGIEGLFVVAGFSGHGFKLAPVIGLGMAQLLAGDRVTAFDLETFLPARFQGAVSWSGTYGL